MKVIDAEQGSPEWHAARAGKLTASRFADIMRKTKTGVSAMRATYMGELVAERLSGQVATDDYKSRAMERGIETEDKARSFYGFINDIVPAKVGFVIHPTIDMAGASPDRLVGDDGLLEIKCPNSATHIKTLLGAPIDPDYLKQIHWQLACTYRKWCDFVSYDDRLPPDMAMHVTRVRRDEVLISEYEAEAVKFLREVEEQKQALLNRYRQEAA